MLVFVLMDESSFSAQTEGIRKANSAAIQISILLIIFCLQQLTGYLLSISGWLVKKQYSSLT